MASSASLLDRAKRHLQHGAVKAGALAIVPLATVSASAAGFSIDGNLIGFDGSGGHIPPDVVAVVGQATNPGGNPITLFGEFGPIDGARFFTNSFSFAWWGHYDGPLKPGDTIEVDLESQISVTGGDLSSNLVVDLGNKLPDDRINSKQIVEDLTVQANGMLAAQFESDPFVAEGFGSNFWMRLEINWSNYNPTDTFEVIVPQGALEVRLIPEPSVITMMAAMALLMINPGRRILRRS